MSELQTAYRDTSEGEFAPQCGDLAEVAHPSHGLKAYHFARLAGNPEHTSSLTSANAVADDLDYQAQLLFERLASMGMLCHKPNMRLKALVAGVPAQAMIRFATMFASTQLALTQFFFEVATEQAADFNCHPCPPLR